MDTLRSLPSVHDLLEDPRAAKLIQLHGRPLVRLAIQGALEGERDRAMRDDDAARWNHVEAAIRQLRQPRLRPVINATGVILHTNLGRAPLAPAAADAAAQVGVRFSTLEFDLSTGKRGRRHDLVSDSLRHLTGAEAAAVVNNCAAAVLLMLTALAKGKEVILGRGEMVEIGGGFRMPEIMRLSGARLVEVGTTNRTRLDDYASAISPRTGAIMKVHASNFQLVGFTEAVAVKPLSDLAHSKGLPLLHDLGSGSLINTSAYRLAEEPTVIESLEAGVDLVAFSGDKLLGGPQAGVLLGQASLVDKVMRHPLARAIRADKLTLAALAATLDLYLTQSSDDIPVVQMLSAQAEAIKRRATAWQSRLAELAVQVDLFESSSTVGGGSLPGQQLETTVLALPSGRSAAQVLRRLRQQDPPVIGRIEGERVLLDPRTVLPDEDDALVEAVARALR
jgi:L-seryl-tRNA(Ser) seleniumtransferase